MWCISIYMFANRYIACGTVMSQDTLRYCIVSVLTYHLHAFSHFWQKLPDCTVDISSICVSCYCVVLCIVCVSMCTVLLSPVVNPIAVNKYILFATTIFAIHINTGPTPGQTLLQKLNFSTKVRWMSCALSFGNAASVIEDRLTAVGCLNFLRIFFCKTFFYKQG